MKVGWMDMSAGAAGDTASGEKIDCELESNKVRLTGRIGTQDVR
jgi:hypothetical protein